MLTQLSDVKICKTKWLCCLLMHACNFNQSYFHLIKEILNFEWVVWQKKERKTTIFSSKWHFFCFQRCIFLLSKVHFPNNTVNIQRGGRRHFPEIQLNREIHKFYPMLISIWTQRNICSKCPRQHTNAASKSMFYLFFGFCQKRILFLTPVSL